MLPFILTFIFSIIGFAIAITVRHTKSKKQSLVCPVGSHCDTVIYSKYGKFLGFDVATLGALYYGLLSVLYGLFIFTPMFIPQYLYMVGFLMTILAVIFSAYLIIIQLFVIKEWCTWCLGSAFVSIGMLVSASVGFDGIRILFLEYKTIIVILHAMSAALGLGTVLITDVFFMKFLSDYEISHGESEVLDTLSQVVWFALALLILTGIALFLPATSALLVSTKFLAKVVIVGVIIVNGVLLNLFIAPKLIDIAFGKITTPDDDMYYLRKFAFAAGAVSIVSWLATFILGSLRSIPLSVGGILAIYLGVVVVVVTGSQVAEYRISHKNK
jgi:uncharacterized membrane protein